MQNKKIKFRQTEIGEIPEEWKVVKLSDIARIEMGQSPKSEYYNGNCEGLPFLQGIKTFGDRHPYFDTWCTKPAKIAESGDILLSVRAPVGVVNISKDRLCIGRGISAIRGKNTNFIYYLLRANSDKIDSRGTGTVYRSINKSDIQNLVFAIPPELEQQQIASILSSLDDKIELNKKMNKTLEEIGKALFKRWFVDFEFPNEERKSYKSSGGKMVNSELGKIPEGWKLGKLSYLVDNIKVSYGGDNLKDMLPYVPIDIINPKNLSLTSTADFQEAKSSLIKFQRFDILFGAMRPYFYKVALAPFDGLTRTTCFILRSKQEEYYSFCVFKVFDNETINFATDHSEGSTIPYAKWNNGLSEMLIVVPDKEIVNRFNLIMKPLLLKICDSYFEIKILTEVQDSLLPRLMSGGLRVN